MLQYTTEYSNRITVKRCVVSSSTPKTIPLCTKLTMPRFNVNIQMVLNFLLTSYILLQSIFRFSDLNLGINLSISSQKNKTFQRHQVLVLLCRLVVRTFYTYPPRGRELAPASYFLVVTCPLLQQMASQRTQVQRQQALALMCRLELLLIYRTSLFLVTNVVFSSLVKVFIFSHLAFLFLELDYLYFDCTLLPCLCFSTNNNVVR